MPTNDNFADAAPLVIGPPADPINSAGLTTEPGEYPDGDGKTAWWTFTPDADGWYVVDSLGTAEAAQANVAGSIYEVAPGDPIDLGSISYVGGFRFQTPAWAAVELFAGTTYWLTMDVRGGGDADYVPRVRAAAFSDWITPTQDTFTDVTFDAAHPNGVTLTAHDTGSSGYILNPGGSMPEWTLRGIHDQPADAWDALRGIPNAISNLITRGLGSVTGWYAGYHRTNDGFDDKLVATRYHPMTLVALDTPYDFPGWAAQTVAGVQYDGVAHWSDLIVTIAPGGTLGYGLAGTPNDDTALRIDAAAHDYSSQSYVAENFTGTGAQLDVTLLNDRDAQSVSAPFVIYPNRLTDPTPLAYTFGNPPTAAWMEVAAVKVSFKVTRRRFRFIYPAGAPSPLRIHPRSSTRIHPRRRTRRPGTF